MFRQREVHPKRTTRCWSCGQCGVHRSVDQCLASLKVAVSRARLAYPHRAAAYQRMTRKAAR